MAYQVLARKYRPQRFSDVKGQEHVTRTLLNALTQGRIAHGYIFSGHRGIGKTTIARILAMALNCRTEVGSAERPTVEPCLKCDSCREIASGGNPDADNQAMHSFDFIEIDAASNRGIDDVRSIRSQATVQPARDRYKIFLLDEAHQITDAAFNAILKTLEEPPEWAIFMMATTQPEDIPQTIRSRCQHFSFHAVRFDEILDQLKSIVEQENLTAEDAALALLAEAGDGSMRDALSIMDQAIASAPIEDGKARLSAEQIRELMGTVPNAVFERLLEAISENQSATVIEEVNRLLNAGNSASQIARQFVRYLRNSLMARLGGEQTELLQVSPDERARAARSALLFSEEDLTRFLDIMLRTFDQLNYRQEQRFHLELGLLKLVHLQRLLPIEQFLSQLPAGAKTSVAAGPSSRPALSTARAAGTAVPPRGPSASSGPLAGAGSPGSSGTGSGRSPEPKTGPAPRPAPNAAPTFSPFEADRNRKSGGESMQGPGSESGQGHGGASMQASAGGIEARSAVGLVEAAIVEASEPRKIETPLVPFVEPAPIQPQFSAAMEPAARAVTHLPEANGKPPMASPASSVPVETTNGALALAPAAANDPVDVAPDLDAIRDAVCSALEVEGHNTAAALLSAGRWSVSGSEIRVEVAIKKMMLSLTMNAEADKICKGAMRAIGAMQKLTVVPGENLGPAQPRAAATPRPAATGSIQAEALANPLVKQAQELFSAEVRSVLDLREKQQSEKS